MVALSQAAGPETCSPTGRTDMATREVGETGEAEGRVRGLLGCTSPSAGKPTSEVSNALKRKEEGFAR